LEIYRKLC